MQLARVIGDIVATRKDSAFDGVTLLLVQPLGADGGAVGRPLVAVDAVGAGVGEHVFFVRGKEASFPFHPVEVPADAGIVGIVDHWTTGERDAVTRPSRRAGATAERSAGTSAPARRR
ncbi:MAG: EutN/CcmL family microcompartment protein [Acidobacteria bacterium]|nr:EutN/CcmL family microcompartment protein [Acidobacteriota bacterium]